jgi:hypothetical protein
MARSRAMISGVIERSPPQQAEIAIRVRGCGIVLDRNEQFWHGLIEAPAEEMR